MQDFAKKIKHKTLKFNSFEIISVSDAKKVDSIEGTEPEAKSAEQKWTAAEVAALAEAQAKKAAQKAAEAKAAADAKAQEEYEAAAKEASAATADSKFTNKRAGEQIFRREMEEPEFWLTKEGLIPPRPILTKEEEDEITKRVEIPTDQIPDYKPQHMLSPEYGGISNYEIGINTYRDELEEALDRLRADPESTEKEIKKAQEDLDKMDSLYENYYVGMNVFRTAKGGRDKIR